MISIVKSFFSNKDNILISTSCPIFFIIGYRLTMTGFNKNFDDGTLINYILQTVMKVSGIIFLALFLFFLLALFISIYSEIDHYIKLKRDEKEHQEYDQNK